MRFPPEEGSLSAILEEIPTHGLMHCVLRPPPLANAGLVLIQPSRIERCSCAKPNAARQSSKIGIGKAGPSNATACCCRSTTRGGNPSAGFRTAGRCRNGGLLRTQGKHTVRKSVAVLLQGDAQTEASPSKKLPVGQRMQKQ